MARSSMANLIARIRLDIGDPIVAGTPPTSVFSDDQIQDYCDQERRKQWVRYARLRPIPTYTPGGGVVSWLDFFGDRGEWEEDAQLVNASYAVLTPDTSDYIGGHWHFNANTLPAVRIVGQCYDRFGIDADLLRAWAAQQQLSFDFSADGQSFRRSQKYEMLMKRADDFDARSWPQVAVLTRSDLSGEYGSGLGAILPFPAAPPQGEWGGF